MKECTSLAAAGHEVFLVAQGDSRKENGVTVVGIGEKPSSRLSRMFSFSKKIYQAAKELDCDIYHFHDPELLPYGLKLKKAGKKVIFDSHEDVSGQIEDKYWIPKIARKLVSFFYFRYETYVVKQLDAVVAATSHIGDTFKGRAKKTVIINNYPILTDIRYQGISPEGKEDFVCYAGGMNEIRGIKVLFDAFRESEATLLLAGPRDQDAEKYFINDGIDVLKDGPVKER